MTEVAIVEHVRKKKKKRVESTDVADWQHSWAKGELGRLKITCMYAHLHFN
jgi:hypothetical protein